MAFTEKFHSGEIKLWIFVTIIHLSASSRPTFQMHSSDQHYVVDPGSEKSMYCEFTKTDYNLFDNPFQWRKSQYGESSEMNIMGNIKAPFESTGRFTVTFLETPPMYTSILTIRNISRVDSGNYSCEVKGPKSAELGSVHYTLYAKEPVTELSIVQANFSRRSPSAVPLLIFTENASTPLRCVSKGGSPPPAMEITIGRENHTKQFRFDSMYSVTGPVGFRSLQITTMMVTDDFRAMAVDDGKRLECKAKVVGLSEVVRSADISVRYAPRINCSSPSAYLGTNNVRLNCTVISHPPVSSWYWVLDDNGRRITERDDFPDYWILFTYDKRSNVLMLDLYVKEATEETFRVYKVVASNSVGSVAKNVTLTRKRRSPPVWENADKRDPPYENRHSGRASRDPSSLYANGSLTNFRTSCIIPSIILSITLLTCLRVRR